MDQSSFILKTSGKSFPKLFLSVETMNVISLKFLASFFQLEPILDDSYVRDFLENDSERILSASLNDTRKSIQFQNKTPNEYQNVLLFYKIKPKENSQQDGHRSELGMLTLEGGIVKSIYNSLTSIFIPNAINVSINCCILCNSRKLMWFYYFKNLEIFLKILSTNISR